MIKQFIIYFLALTILITFSFCTSDKEDVKKENENIQILDDKNKGKIGADIAKQLGAEDRQSKYFVNNKIKADVSLEKRNNKILLLIFEEKENSNYDSISNAIATNNKGNTDKINYLDCIFVDDKAFVPYSDFKNIDYLNIFQEINIRILLKTLNKLANLKKEKINFYNYKKVYLVYLDDSYKAISHTIKQVIQYLKLYHFEIINNKALLERKLFENKTYLSVDIKKFTILPDKKNIDDDDLINEKGVFNKDEKLDIDFILDEIPSTNNEILPFIVKKIEK